jgi:WD40 repeat protein
MPGRGLVLLIALLACVAAQPALGGTATPLSLTSFGGIAVDDAHQQVLVSSGQFGSSITVLDFDGELVTTITGQQGANGMALDPSTGILYVALQNASSISRIDTETLTEISRFATTGMSGPRKVALAGGRLWFDYNCGGPGGIGSAALDGSDVGPEGGAECLTFATSPGDPDLLAAAVIRRGSVYVWDVSTGNLVETTNASSPGGGDDITDIALTPDATELLIASREPSAVNSFLISDFTLARSFPTGPYPTAVAGSADGQFVAGGAESAADKDIFVFQADETPVRSWDVGGSGNLLSDRGLAFSADAQRLFAVTHDPAGNVTFRTTATPTATPAPTSITLALSKSKVVFGGSLTLSAHLSGATGSVSFYATPTGGTTALLGAVAVNASGNASLVVKPSGKTTYTADFVGDDAAAPSTSPGKTVLVQARVSVALRKFYGRSGKYRLYHYPHDPFVVGTVSPDHYGMSVKFIAERYRNGAWRPGTARTIAITPDGKAYAYLRNTIKESYRVRVVFPGDADHLASRSPWAYLRVTS